MLHAHLHGSVHSVVPGAAAGLVAGLSRIRLSDFNIDPTAFVIVPLKILLVIVLAYLASRFSTRLIRRLFNSVSNRQTIRAISDRAPRRADAIASTTASITRVAIWAIAIPIVLGDLGVNLGPFIAGATIIGAALGFGAQSLVKDLLAGFMILTEDQYAVGDTIQVGPTSGTVEDVTLLRTRFRADDGKVWFVANGEIRSVANSSMGWSRATVDVAIPFEADLDAAVVAARREAVAFAEDPEWSEAILAPPQAYGQAVEHDHLTLRVTARSRTPQSASVARALLARVNRAVRAAPDSGDGRPPDASVHPDPVHSGDPGDAPGGPGDAPTSAGD